MSNLKIIMTGGGSAGHVTPNLALIPELKKRGYEIKYVGSKDGIEKKIIEDAGIPYAGISSGKIRRYFDLKNFSDPFKVIKGVFEAYSYIKKEKPNVVFSKGGFVSVPVVIGAHLNKVPVVAHESDMTPGLANKISIPYCKKICVTFPEALKNIKDGKGVLTGTPIRKELLLGSKEKGKKIAGFKIEKPVLLIIGGSLGSKRINDSVREALDDILKDFNVIHICGKGNLDNNLKKKVGYIQFEYVNEELPHLFALSDLVISRGGANAIFELLALKKPHIIIPLSKNASRGDQILNAESFKKQGYSMVLQDEEVSKETLLKNLKELYKYKDKYIETMKKSSLNKGVENVINVIVENTKK